MNNNDNYIIKSHDKRKNSVIRYYANDNKYVLFKEDARILTLSEAKEVLRNINQVYYNGGLIAKQKRLNGETNRHFTKIFNIIKM